jgi:single-stranded-DNA-specific exonuclease
MEAAIVVIAVRGEESSGSVRCDAGMNALGWMESMADLFDDFGGHPQAGGFRIPTARIGELDRRTLKWLEDTGHSPVESDIIRIDAELTHEEISRLGPEGLDNLLERLEPYGEGFRPITFLTRRVMVHQADLMGKPKNNHLKLLVTLGQNKWPALWWDGAGRYGKVIRKGFEVDLVYRVDRDRWRGAEARRLTILEASPCIV